MMLKAAFDATGIREYLKLQRKAFHWFLGENDLQIPVYDFKTKGSADGLEETGLNMNQGAESLLSFFLSLLCTVEGYETAPKTDKDKTSQIIENQPRVIKEIIVNDPNTPEQKPEAPTPG